MVMAFLFLGLRAIHVLVAGLWIGSTVFMSRMLTPAIEASGPSGGQVMLRINRRGLTAYMAGLGVTTAATGLYLLWHFTGGFDTSVSLSHAGLAFCTGGTSGILAGVVGGAVLGRGGARMSTVMETIGTQPDGPAKLALVEEAAALHRRMKAGSNVVIALQTVALVLMSVGHYI
jgi:hypothetical protein